jgi:REP element-mobilizing transposase RayT
MEPQPQQSDSYLIIARKGIYSNKFRNEIWNFSTVDLALKTYYEVEDVIWKHLYYVDHNGMSILKCSHTGIENCG